MKIFLMTILLLFSSCAMFTKTMYVDSMKDVDTAHVKIYHIDSTGSGVGKVYILDYRDK